MFKLLVNLRWYLELGIFSTLQQIDASRIVQNKKIVMNTNIIWLVGLISECDVLPFQYGELTKSKSDAKWKALKISYDYMLETES